MSDPYGHDPHGGECDLALGPDPPPFTGGGGAIERSCPYGSDVIACSAMSSRDHVRSVRTRSARWWAPDSHSNLILPRSRGWRGGGGEIMAGRVGHDRWFGHERAQSCPIRTDTIRTVVSAGLAIGPDPPPVTGVAGGAI